VIDKIIRFRATQASSEIPSTSCRDAVARRDIPKVVGGVGPVGTELACALYGTIFDRTIPVSSPKAAEMTKLLENIYRCVNIALVNELKQLCERMGIDIFEVIDAAKTKPFGFQAFYPGPGLGGHCILIDPFYLSWKALKGATVLVLGLAYKRDVDDLRESPSLVIIELLKQRGAVVCYHDPYFPAVGRGRCYDLNMTCAALENLGQYDCVMIVTDHSDYDYLRIVAKSQLVVDTRNATKGIHADNIVRC